MPCASSADVRTSEAGAEESPGLASSAPSNLASGPAARLFLELRGLLGFLDHLIGDEVALELFPLLGLRWNSRPSLACVSAMSMIKGRVSRNAPTSRIQISVRFGCTSRAAVVLSSINLSVTVHT